MAKRRKHPLWRVVELNISQDPVEVTSGGAWGVDENGDLWVDPPDTHRKFVPGMKSATITLSAISDGEMPRINNLVRLEVNDATG